MSKIVVIYKSKYGYTKKYAEWIAQELDAALFEHANIKPAQLSEYDLVIYGGGLYAGGINGIKIVTKNPCKALIVFTVGLADPKITDYTPVLEQSFTPEQLAGIKVLHLRGGVDYAKLGFIHKGLLAVVKKAADKKPLAERTSEDCAIIEAYGTQTDFTDKAALVPLIEYVRKELRMNACS